MNTNPSRERRNVVVDVETISLDPADEKGAVSALRGRLACIGMLMDDGTEIHEVSIAETDERCMLERYWKLVRPTDQFIGFNLWSFDLQFIRQRSWLLQVPPSRRIDLRKFYSSDFVDLMQLWTNWGCTSWPKLEELAAALGCAAPAAQDWEVGKHHTQVAAWWDDGNLAAIAAGCRYDIRQTYRVFWKLMFRPIPQRLVDVEAATAAVKGAA